MTAASTNARVERAIKYLRQLQFGDHVELARVLAVVDPDFLHRLERAFGAALDPDPSAKD